MARRSIMEITGHLYRRSGRQSTKTRVFNVITISRQGHHHSYFLLQRVELVYID
jgi:hypothetical protein